jgi:apolipoprotein N-acyltransferase
MTEMIPIADAGLTGFTAWLFFAVFLMPVHILIAFHDGWGIHATSQMIVLLFALPGVVLWVLRKHHSMWQRVLNLFCAYAGLMTATNFLVRLIFG